MIHLSCKLLNVWQLVTLQQEMNIDTFLLRLFPGAARRNWGQMHIQGEEEGPSHPLIFLKDKDTSPKVPRKHPVSQLGDWQN